MRAGCGRDTGEIRTRCRRERTTPPECGQSRTAPKRNPDSAGQPRAGACRSIARCEIRLFSPVFSARFDDAPPQVFKKRLSLHSESSRTAGRARNSAPPPGKNVLKVTHHEHYGDTSRNPLRRSERPHDNALRGPLVSALRRIVQRIPGRRGQNRPDRHRRGLVRQPARGQHP